MNHRVANASAGLFVWIFQRFWDLAVYLFRFIVRKSKRIDKGTHEHRTKPTDHTCQR